MAETHFNRLPRWTHMTLSQVKVPRRIGETIALAGHSLYPLERLDYLTEELVRLLLRAHPIQVTDSGDMCLGGLLSLQMAHYLLPASASIPVTRIPRIPDATETEQAALELLGSVIEFGAARRCECEALAAVRYPIANTEWAESLLPGLNRVKGFAEMTGVSRAKMSRAVNAVRRRREGDR